MSDHVLWLFPRSLVQYEDNTAERSADCTKRENYGAGGAERANILDPGWLTETLKDGNKGPTSVCPGFLLLFKMLIMLSLVYRHVSA